MGLVDSHVDTDVFICILDSFLYIYNTKGYSSITCVRRIYFNNHKCTNIFKKGLLNKIAFLKLTVEYLQKMKKEFIFISLLSLFVHCFLFLLIFLVKNSISSTVHTAPFPRCTLTKHLCRDRLCRTAF